MSLLNAFWNFTALSAPYLILGLVISGFIKQFLPIEKIQKWLGKNNMASVFKAAIIGVPLPLCSCSVIPTAVTLRKSGASTGATSAFLISTPESGVDSISVTYALMDLPMAIIRPVAAFVSAMVAGTLQIIFNREFQIKETPKVKSCCGSEKRKEKGESHDHAHHHETKHVNNEHKIIQSFKYAFIDLIDDIAFWLFIGLFLGAIISVAVPENFFNQMDINQSRFLILLIGIPLYICASATTPIAAALVLKGASPGTALLLLLVGPATNLSNIAVLQKYIGKKGVGLNIIAIVITALIFSFITDYFYGTYLEMNWPAIHSGHDEHLGILSHLSAGFILILVAKGIYTDKLKKYLK